MVGDGKAEKIGAVVGGVAGGIAGGVLDGPLPIGDIVGGIAGSKIPAVRSEDKLIRCVPSVLRKVSEATYPSDFVNPDGSKRAVAKKKTGRPVQHDQAMSGGRRKTVDEEASDAMKDRRLERGGVGGNTNYKKPPVNNTNKFGTGKTALQKEMEKKKRQMGQKSEQICRNEDQERTYLLLLVLKVQLMQNQKTELERLTSKYGWQRLEKQLEVLLVNEEIYAHTWC